MANWHRLTVLRKVAIALSFALAAGAFIADATVLAYLDKYFIRGRPVNGVAGWTMFATVSSLVVLPLLLTRSSRIQRWLNRTAIELAILGVFTLFYFISGIVLASKSGDRSCLTSILCQRVKATAAFCWVAFAALILALIVVGLIARAQSRLGLPLFTAYSFDIEGEEITPPVPAGSHDMHAAAMSIGGAYLGNNSSVAQVRQSAIVDEKSLATPEPNNKSAAA
ncbi:hypothetical protein H4S08_000829 [Coemansia sp. RSA 1365]|nr:hypothetical protein H4S08_000829 [Coemansia sp. RSA 1365]